MIQTKHRPEYKREDYYLVKRNPIAIVSFSTDSRNVGGMIRTAESFLVERVYTEVVPSLATSCGAEKWQNWYKPVVSMKEFLTDAIWHNFYYTPVVLEQTDKSVPLTHFKLPEKMLLVVGNEVTGVPQESLDFLDKIHALFVQIPQFGFSRSLNVTTATSIVLYEWIRQHATVGNISGK